MFFFLYCSLLLPTMPTVLHYSIVANAKQELMQNLLALKKICISSCFSTYSVVFFLSLNFLLTFPLYTTVSLTPLFLINSSLPSLSLICFLFYLLSLFCFLTNFSALHLQYYSFVFHKLLFTILHMVSFLFCFVSFPSFCSSTPRIPYYLSTQYFFTSRLSSLFQGITDSFRLEKIFKVISLSHELSVS